MNTEPNRITITAATGTWVVRAGGAVIGESTRALELAETGHDPVIYFPRDDIEMAFLDASTRTSSNPFKGEARYFSIVAKSGAIEDSVWSYEDPLPAVARIKDHLAFYASDKVTIEQV